MSSEFTPRADFAPKLARILTEYCCPIEKGQYVVISGYHTAQPLIEALFGAVLRRGGHPTLLPGLISTSSSPVFDLFLREASPRQLDFVDPLLLEAGKRADVIYFIKAPASTRSLVGIDPERLDRYNETLAAFRETYLPRWKDFEMSWLVTAWPTAGLAAEADMDLPAYTEFVYNACGLNEPDPVTHWHGLRQRQERLVGWLNGKKRAEVRGPGIDLSFSFAGRPWVNSAGEVNFPDGEIFCSPEEHSVNGYIHFNMATRVGGQQVSGVRLRFQDGRAVEASAEQGNDVLLHQIEIDSGARRLGEFGIGTNQGIQKITGMALFDEKIGGTIHIALGDGLYDSRGQNESAIHWDMVHDMRKGGTITVDGELFYRDGAFVVE